MPKPIDAYGDPESVFCRWCDEGRVRVRGTMFCNKCDGRDDGLHTWRKNAA